VDSAKALAVSIYAAVRIDCIVDARREAAGGKVKGE
jgi:hypothetical protein